jgi:IPT/TIG domain
VLNFPDSPVDGEVFVANPKASFTWTGGNRWQRVFVPQPTLTLLDPNNILINETAPCVLTGTNFSASSVVRWAGVDTPPTFISATELNMPIPVRATPGAVDVAVVNGVVVGNSLPFSYIAPDPPILDALAPDNGPTNSAAIVIRVQGQNFTNPSTVTFDGVTIPSVFVTTTELTVTAPLSLWEMTAKVKVQTPYGTTLEKDFRYVPPVHPPGARPPLIETCVPNDINRFTSDVWTVRITGQYFAAGTRVLLNGMVYPPRNLCAVIDANNLDWTLDITHPDVLADGQYSINLETPPYMGTNPNLLFYIRNM